MSKNSSQIVVYFYGIDKINFDKVREDFLVKAQGLPLQPEEMEISEQSAGRLYSWVRIELKSHEDKQRCNALSRQVITDNGGTISASDA